MESAHDMLSCCVRPPYRIWYICRVYDLNSHLETECVSSLDVQPVEQILQVGHQNLGAELGPRELRESLSLTGSRSQCNVLPLETM